MTDSRTLKTLLCISVLLLAACGADPQSSQRGLLRKQYFDECMRLVPPGPQQTHYNDWAEVVSACDNAACLQANQVMP